MITKNIYKLINELNSFDYKLEFSDHIWQIIFPDEKEKWHNLSITKYQETYYIYLADEDLEGLEVKPKKIIKFPGDQYSINKWNNLIIAALNWMHLVKKNWVRAYKLTQEKYPFNRRFGTLPHSFVKAMLQDIYQVDKELGKAKTKKFIKIVESNYFRDYEKTIRKSLTANDFFNYCKIAYLASQDKNDKIDKNLSGREMYKLYADGRDEGLLEIAGNSEKAFADWLSGKHPKKTTGGHPWEIRRGGNTTHIDLHVRKHDFREGFEVVLAGNAITRLKETICMFLGIYDAGLPITILNPENIRLRILAQDNIGIVPCYHSLHRGNQLFYEEQKVFDVMHYDDLGRHKVQLKPFITWKPLPILKPK